jgi:hypothetical protein
MTEILGPDGHAIDGEPTHEHAHHDSVQWRRLEARFFTANQAGRPPATEQQLAVVKRLRGAILDLAWVIETGLPAGRHKALALTELEDLQMRANRGVFADPEGML